MLFRTCGVGVGGDHFTGNISLKHGERLAKLIYDFINQEVTRSAFSKMAALAAMPALKALGKRMDPRNYNGASFVGGDGIVIKSHGSADAQAFVAAIRVALREVENEVPSRIARLLADALPARVPDTTLA